MNSVQTLPEPHFPAVGEESLEAVRRAVREALAAHGQAGRPIVVWRGGDVVRIEPDSNGKYAE